MATTDLLEGLSPQECTSLSAELDSFVVLHTGMHRPVALVSSGGTAVDLELHAVRSLDNFSTGLRGAMSVEGLLRRGYAVIHLWRRGSAAPFARVLAQQLGLAANEALDSHALGRLLEGDEEEDSFVQEVLRKEDPWLMKNPIEGGVNPNILSDDSSSDGLHISRSLRHSTQLQKALRERKQIIQENRLLTVPFRTVDEYLAKLQLCSKAIHQCHSLALVYLAAAVSDFYIPLSERSQHKIQSSENSGGLTLQLKPVPKTIGLLRKEWAPSAFCVSFKLETDHDILRTKAERAVQSYGVHMVIGNILETRYNTVWILHPEDQRALQPTNANGWTFAEVSRSSPSEDLEELILDHVVQSHFEFIAWHFHADGSGAEAAKQAQKALKEKKQRVKRELFWKRATYYGSEVAGWLLSFALSYAATAALQRLSTSPSSSKAN